MFRFDDCLGLVAVVVLLKKRIKPVLHGTIVIFQPAMYRQDKVALRTVAMPFEDAGLLFSVNIFSISPTRISVNPRKVYCIDHALVSSVSSGILTNRDSLLENLVFTALHRVTPEIFYHKTKTGREVDLVVLLASVPGQERAILLIQVCASLADPRVRQSEVRSLSEAMVELAVAEGTIVTWRTDETIPVGFGTIRVVPVWRFLLELEPRT